MTLSYKEMQHILMEELRLYHFPIAVKFFFDQSEVAEFKKVHDYYTPVKPMTFCQWEIAARMKGQIVYAEPKGLGCSNAMCGFAWKEIDDNEIKSHLKYVRDEAQAQKAVQTKPRLKSGLIGVAVAPLGDAKFVADTVHFYCDNMQAYHLAVDWMSATGIYPMRANITINSSACAGNVYVYNEKLANMLPACSGSYNAGKTERGEINFILPGEHLEPMVKRLLERKETYGSAAITRPGDGFPGADICKNCPLIIFKKGE
ncbi:DUF169 domain-containing protein [Desulfobulbus elongatus]|uniref:DUF169 domain-containing protein n=1 Tax=Desulfobulbus elongatus TaxID=53332 RepID=UPI000481A65B|nr:DUF169 domain-containing protein [Desulfobulbus elongatus]